MRDVIIIIVYYCQDTRLFHEANSHVSATDWDVDGHDILHSIRLLLGFSWEVLTRLFRFCTMIGATAQGNQAISVFFVPYLLAIFGFLWLLCYLKSIAKDMRYTYVAREGPDTCGQLLGYALFLTLLMTFGHQVYLSAALIKCVPYMNETVLYLNGNVTCFQNWWQYIAAIYLCLWLAPFPLILVVGAPLLGQGHLSFPTYLLLCIFPIPLFLYVVVKIIIRKVQNTFRLELNNNSTFVTDFLQNNQRKLPFWLDYLCCHGIVVMFRFAMVMMHTFNDDVIKGMTGVLILVFTKLVYTAVASPYSSFG